MGRAWGSLEVGGQSVEAEELRLDIESCLMGGDGCMEENGDLFACERHADDYDRVLGS